MTDHISIRIQRNMAWERAKGELKSMLHTFYSDGDSRDNQYNELNDELAQFIEKIESKG